MVLQDIIMDLYRQMVANNDTVFICTNPDKQNLNPSNKNLSQVRFSDRNGDSITTLMPLDVNYVTCPCMCL